MAWDYAELSKLAKANGGPAELVDLLIEHGKEIGESKALRRVRIVVAAGFVVAGIYKLVDYFSKKKAVSDAAVEAAREEIIQGINDYDAEHPDDDDENISDSDDNETEQNLEDDSENN